MIITKKVKNGQVLYGSIYMFAMTLNSKENQNIQTIKLKWQKEDKRREYKEKNKTEESYFQHKNKRKLELLIQSLIKNGEN